METLEAVNFGNPKGLKNILEKLQVASVKNKHAPTANMIAVFAMMEESTEGFW